MNPGSVIVHSDFMLNDAFWQSAGFKADKGSPDEEMGSVAVIICFENSENSMQPIAGRIWERESLQKFSALSIMLLQRKEPLNKRLWGSHNNF